MGSDRKKSVGQLVPDSINKRRQVCSHSTDMSGLLRGLGLFSLALKG